jgi:hypothetical protein
MIIQKRGLLISGFKKKVIIKKKSIMGFPGDKGYGAASFEEMQEAEENAEAIKEKEAEAEKETETEDSEEDEG